MRSAIGNTKLVYLRNVVPPDCGSVAVKLEFQNPTGSMKDRMAVAAIAGAEADEPIGHEAWQQTGGHIDAFVQMVGTAHSLRGTAAALKAHNPNCTIVAVEPAESPVLGGGKPGAHGIEGVGIGFMPPLWNAAIVDRVVPISTGEAKTMARRLAREEGLFAGTSTGANVCAAIHIAREMGPRSTVLTLAIDSGLKYLSTDLYRS